MGVASRKFFSTLPIPNRQHLLSNDPLLTSTFFIVFRRNLALSPSPSRASFFLNIDMINPPLYYIEFLLKPPSSWYFDNIPAHPSHVILNGMAFTWVIHEVFVALTVMEGYTTSLAHCLAVAVQWKVTHQAQLPNLLIQCRITASWMVLKDIISRYTWKDRHLNIL